VDWFVTTLIKTPGHAPADTVASAWVINQIQMPGGVAQVTQQLIEARKTDPQAQLFPEITVSTIGQDYMRAGEPKSAIDVLKVVLLAYPDSTDANDNLAAAYLKDGQKIWRGSTPKRRWRFWMRIRSRHHRGPTRTNTAARFAAARRKHLRRQQRTQAD